MFAGNLEKQILDCFVISIHLKSCHCIVHKHLKQDTMILKMQKPTFKIGVTMTIVSIVSPRTIQGKIPNIIVGKVVKLQLLTAMHFKVIHKNIRGGGLICFDSVCMRKKQLKVPVQVVRLDN